jgi:hypothetical protein
MPDLFWIEIAGGTFVFCSLASWLHLRRVHRWQEILKSPVREAIKKIPPKSKFLKKFPEFDKTSASKSLQEALDQTLGAKEVPVLATQLFEFFAKEQSLKEKIKRSFQKDGEKQGHPISSGHAPENSGLIRADEEKIQTIVALPSYHADPALPVEVVASSVISNLVKAFRGQKPFKTAIEHAVLDSFGASGGFAGAKAGALAAISVTPWLAVGLAPYWIPVAMVIGAGIGSIAGRKIAHRVKERKFYATQNHLKHIAGDFKQELLVRTPEMQLELENDLVQRHVSLTRMPSSSRFKRFFYFFYPDLLSIWVQLSAERLANERKLSRKNWRLLRRRIKKLRFDNLDRLIHQVNEKSLSSYPKLIELRSQYTQYQYYKDTSMPSNVEPGASRAKS